MTKELLDIKRRVMYCEGLCSYIHYRDWPEDDGWRVKLLWRQLADELELLKAEMELVWPK